MDEKLPIFEHFTDYISAACNATSFAVDCYEDNSIIFASGRSVIIMTVLGYPGSGSKITHTLYAHKDRVNCVKSLKSFSDKYEFVSVSADSSAIIWMKTGEDDNVVVAFQPKIILAGHSGQIYSVAALKHKTHNGTECLLLATVDEESILKVWMENEDKFDDVDTHKLGPRLGRTVAMDHYPDSNVPFIACVLNDRDICFLNANASLNKNQGECHIFSFQCTFNIHSDWVNVLNFHKDDSGMILVSGSSDKNVCLTRLSKCEKRTQRSFVDVEDSLKLNVRIEFDDELWEITPFAKYRQRGAVSNVCCLGSGSGELQIFCFSASDCVYSWTTSGSSVDFRMAPGCDSRYAGGCVSLTQKFVLAYATNGSFHLWLPREDTWKNVYVPGGHNDDISSLSWDGKGRFLLSTSKDMTTRLHAPVMNAIEDIWVELARPQVHGFPINLTAPFGDYNFVSAAMESELRVFKAPKPFVQFITKYSYPLDTIKDDFSADFACVPLLRLSTEAAENPISGNLYDMIGEHPFENYAVPHEGHLSNVALWHETEKLYKHSVPVNAMAISHNGDILVTATAANVHARQTALVVIWSTLTWTVIDEMKIMKPSSITSLASSPDHKFLLIVGRDWSLYRWNMKLEKPILTLVTSVSEDGNPHKRQILGCAWSNDAAYFFTVSRDMVLAVWSGEMGECCGSKFLDTSTECVAIAPDFAPSGYYVIAVGSKCGSIAFYTWKNELNLWEILSGNDSHNQAVTCLSFRPIKTFENNSYCSFQLACGSKGGCLKIQKLNLKCAT